MENDAVNHPKHYKTPSGLETIDVIEAFTAELKGSEAKGAEANEDYNRFFLRAQEEMANHMLRARGVLFLNEVYDMLGIDRSIAGQAVGWVYDRDSEDGDNYVDFGVQEVYRKKSDAPGDYEKVFLLDFNVDGAILGHSVDKGLLTA